MHASYSILEHTPSILEYIPNILEHTPSILEYIPSILEYIPNILEHTPSILEYTPNILEHTPSILEHTPSILEYTGIYKLLYDGLQVSLDIQLARSRCVCIEGRIGSGSSTRSNLVRSFHSTALGIYICTLLVWPRICHAVSITE